MQLMRAILLIAMLGTSAAAEVVEGVVIDDARVGIAGATVRIVGEATVTTVYANAYGQFRVTLLPPGSYRIEVVRGTIREPYSRLQLDRRRDWRSCILPPPPRSFEPPPIAPFPIRSATPTPTRIIELSTTLGIRLGSRELFGR